MIFEAFNFDFLNLFNLNDKKTEKTQRQVFIPKK